MRPLGLQVGFGELQPAIRWHELSTLPLTLARLGAGASPEQTRQFILQPVAHGIRPWVIVPDAVTISTLPHRIPMDVELMNEPDIGTDAPDHTGMSVADYRAQLWMAYGLVWSRLLDGDDVRLWVGAASNTTREALEWLEGVLRDVPRWVGASSHYYPHGDDLRAPHPGYQCRQDEWKALRRVVGDRPLGISEFGASNAIWSEAATAAHLGRLVDEFAWDLRAEAAMLFQHNDGESDHVLDHYGIRRIDGSWKPAADLFRGTR